jgi:hypothetical protein
VCGHRAGNPRESPGSAPPFDRLPREILLSDVLRLAARAARDDAAFALAVTPGVPHVFQGFAAALDQGDAALGAPASLKVQFSGTRMEAVSPSHAAVAAGGDTMCGSSSALGGRP